MRASTIPFAESLRVPSAPEVSTDPDRSRTSATRNPAVHEASNAGLVRLFCQVPVEFVVFDRDPDVMNSEPER